jgi:lipoprotein-releasing system permease protein
MFKPLALFIGLRYTRAKKKNHFISFISFSSMLGIALGVAVLITVLSVMNGFDEEIHNRFFGMAPEITINDYSGKMANWQKLDEQLKNFLDVKAVAPYVGGQGLMTYQGQVVPVIINGILPEQEKKLTHLDKKLISGELGQLHGFGIILGRSIANSLGVLIGDKVTVMIPQANVTLAGMIPRFKRFKVVGVFSAGTGFNFDSKLGFINMYDAQKLFQMGDSVSGVKLKIDNVYKAPLITEKLNKALDGQYQVGNWTQQFGAFFKAIKMEKTMMFLILLLIIAVAAFNLVSSLVMVVNDKQAEIAILRTLGATPKTILWVFIIQGLVVGLIGTGLGLVGGLLLASNATMIVNWLQDLMNMQVLSSSVYFVDYLPSKIEQSDIVQVCIVAMTMSLVATIYPARRASKTQIAEALHYE